MTKEARAQTRSNEHYKDILRGVRADLLRKKAEAEDDFVTSLEKGSETKTHLGDLNSPDFAAQRIITDLGRRIQKIEAAIGRIDRGIYGKCFRKEECEGDGEIETELLAKEPTRLYCRECQDAATEEEERRKKIMNFRGGRKRKRR